ncbi:MAG: cytochrome c-type biogenesis protein [Acidimicrobiales bacterium]
MTSRTWRRLSWLGVLLLVAWSLIAGTRGAGDGASPAARSDRIAAELRCPVCQGLSVLDSDSPTAQSIRDDIDRRLADGESDDEIREAYVDRYGEWILLRPRRRGFGAVVWLAPGIAAFAGISTLGVTLWRWRRRLTGQPTAADHTLVAHALEQPGSRS